MTDVRFKLSSEEIERIEELKQHFKINTRPKVLRKCLNQTYDTVKNLWADNK